MNTIERTIPSDPWHAAVHWLVADGYLDLQSAWDACPRADWLLLFAERGHGVDRRAVVRAVAAIARSVLPVFEVACPGDARPRLAIEAAEAWAADPTEARLAAARVAAGAVANEIWWGDDDAVAYAGDTCGAAASAIWDDTAAVHVAVTASAVTRNDPAASVRHADIVRGFVSSPPELS